MDVGSSLGKRLAMRLAVSAGRGGFERSVAQSAERSAARRHLKWRRGVSNRPACPCRWRLGRPCSLCRLPPAADPGGRLAALLRLRKARRAGARRQRASAPASKPSPTSLAACHLPPVAAPAVPRRVGSPPARRSRSPRLPSHSLSAPPSSLACLLTGDVELPCVGQGREGSLPPACALPQGLVRRPSSWQEGGLEQPALLRAGSSRRAHAQRARQQNAAQRVLPRRQRMGGGQRPPEIKLGDGMPAVARGAVTMPRTHSTSPPHCPKMHAPAYHIFPAFRSSCTRCLSPAKPTDAAGANWLLCTAQNPPLP